MINQATHGVAVKNIQRYLRQLSFIDDSIPPVSIDGIFDDVTQQALMAFQHNVGLEETGIADYTTWMLLFDAFVNASVRAPQPQLFSPFPRFPVGYTVDPGSRLFLVEIIQYLLNELTVWMDDIPRNAQSGIFDEDTEAGVREIQRATLLPQTGRVDRATWDALVDAYVRMTEQNA